MDASAPAPIGVVAHYLLLERLDSAGPGELFRARDTRKGRTVAVRWLPPDFARDADARGRFMEDTRSLLALSHQNITTLFDVGEHDGRVYLVFEFLKGWSLHAEMAGRPMKVRRAIELAIQIADAVAGAHAAGFVRGGFSPDSITITSKGHAKIPVFDPAVHSAFKQEASPLRHSDYDSPEEASGLPADERSDIYSVGTILYEMLTTRRPLHRGSAAPSAANRSVPAMVDEIVLKAVAPNANSRFQSAATLAAELRVAGRDARRARRCGRHRQAPGTTDDKRRPVPDPDHRYPAGSGRAGLVAGGALRICPSRSENAERAMTSSIPALRAALMTSVWTCDT